MILYIERKSSVVIHVTPKECPHHIDKTRSFSSAKWVRMGSSDASKVARNRDCTAPLTVTHQDSRRGWIWIWILHFVFRLAVL